MMESALKVYIIITITCERADLGVSLQVVEEHADADGQVAHVVGVHAVPALGAELAPLAHHGVEVAQAEQDGLELRLLGAHLQRLLQEENNMKQNKQDRRHHASLLTASEIMPYQ